MGFVLFFNSMILSTPRPPFEPLAKRLLSAASGYPKSDEDLFLAGYSELCRINLSGGHALEICGGHGRLSSALASVFPSLRVTGMDLYAPSGAEVSEALAHSANLEYVAGNAFDLSRYENQSIDLIWGQAALHHLSHNLDGIRDEAMRVLKPGGRLVFIFEPLGHNPVFAAIRAMRMARHELPDESNLYLSQIERMAGPFSSSEVQVFNFLGYPMKAFSDRLAPLAIRVKSLDHWLFRQFPKLKRQAANCNLVFTK